MIVSKRIRTALLALTLVLGSLCQAQETITTIDELDADNLPTESVVPSVDSDIVVRNRKVSLAKRIDVSISAGLVIDEMFFDNKFFSFGAFYNTSDDVAYGLKYVSRVAGQSDYTKQFSQTASNVRISKAPAPSSIMAASYRYSFLYGKVSFSKNLVLPMSLDTQGDLGMHKVGTQSMPYSAIGLSQKFFTRSRWGVGLTYKIMLYQTLDPVSTYVGGNTQPNESEFSKKIQFSQAFSLDLSYLF